MHDREQKAIQQLRQLTLAAFLSHRASAMRLYWLDSGCAEWVVHSWVPGWLNGRATASSSKAQGGPEKMWLLSK